MRIRLGIDSGQEADRSGAVGTLGEQPVGRALLWALVVALAAMAVWRLCEAAFGQTVEGGKKWSRRLGSLGTAVFYAVICVGVVQTALVGGSSGGRPGDETSKEYTARVLDWPGGRVSVGAFGVVLIVVGVVILMRSLIRKFEKNLRTDEMSPATRRVVAILGIVGGAAWSRPGPAHPSCWPPCGTTPARPKDWTRPCARSPRPRRARPADRRRCGPPAVRPLLVLRSPLAQGRRARDSGGTADRGRGPGDTSRCALARGTHPAAWDPDDQQAEQSFGDRADDAQHDRGNDDRAPSVPFGTVNCGRHGYRQTTERSRKQGCFPRSGTS
ncbi:DUF1206 domain-containing protein [Streptomyces sp. P9-A4]|uniref:DUF1206 domain-containing protein n=1 Tax=Streptomyces sp. P9-A4 TaxID=3072285 RepID=UPI003FCC97CF